MGYFVITYTILNPEYAFQDGFLWSYIQFLFVEKGGSEFKILVTKNGKRGEGFQK